MRYMGSKDRYAKHIVPILMGGHDDTKWYVEPFVGGGNMIYQIPASKRWGNDTAMYAIALLDSLSRGWIPPSNVSEESYKAIKANPERFPPELVGFCAYSCSYAGKFWGGYARGNDSNGNPRNFASEQQRNLLKQAKGLSGIKFTNDTFLNLDIPDGSTVYCDPPYANTTSYKSTFDHDVFWKWATDLSERCRVFVSEYSAPDGWKPVWQKQVTSSLTKNTGEKKAIESLFERK